MKTLATLPATAVREFQEWASHFSGSLFVKLCLYADESGTHDDTGEQVGSRFPVVGGLIAYKETFTKFTGEWAEVLYRYEMPYFHANEWHTANSISREEGRKPKEKDKKNPYLKWRPKGERHNFDPFILDLAKIISRSAALPLFAGGIDAKEVHEGKLNGKYVVSEETKHLTVRLFYNHVMNHINLIKPEWADEPITFFFELGDEAWCKTILTEFKVAKSRFENFREISFVEKKDMPHLPVQAADMIAFRYRQMMESYKLKEDVKLWDPVDRAIFSETFSGFDQRLVLNSVFQSALDDAFKK